MIFGYSTNAFKKYTLLDSIEVPEGGRSAAGRLGVEA